MPALAASSSLLLARKAASSSALSSSTAMGCDFDEVGSEGIIAADALTPFSLPTAYIFELLVVVAVLSVLLNNVSSPLMSHRCYCLLLSDLLHSDSVVLLPRDNIVFRVGDRILTVAATYLLVCCMCVCKYLIHKRNTNMLHEEMPIPFVVAEYRWA